MTIQKDIFRRRRSFIQVAIGNVEEAIRDGAVWVVVILFLFLWNFRTSLITLTAIPLSIIVTLLVFRYFEISINTMTLGGLAVAIGELVDDSIVDIENIYRRLKENRHNIRPEHPLRVIFLASSEVRNSIVYATLIVVVVVFPLFFLPGLEGRLFAPLGLSYVVTLLASLVVSLTITPCAGFVPTLPQRPLLGTAQTRSLHRSLAQADRRETAALFFAARLCRAGHRHKAMLYCSVLMTSILWMGGEFLPPFNEGTLTIEASTPPSTSLAESNRIGTLIEKSLLEIPEVTHVSRRTGRAEMDEHAENVNHSEIDVGLIEPQKPKPGFFFAAVRMIPGMHGFGVEKVGRLREEVLADIRDRLTAMPGVVSNIGQPISHRLDHIMSGIRAQIAVKLSGPDLASRYEKTPSGFATVMDESSWRGRSVCRTAS